jgi:DNA-binding NarL/FixJ family response regulator
MRAARMGDAVQAGGPPIAVTIEASSTAERMDVFVRAFGFSSREAELLSHLVAGVDTRHVAQRMFLSEHTVQDHLKSIFTRTGSRNRRALLARVGGR